MRLSLSEINRQCADADYRSKARRRSSDLGTRLADLLVSDNPAITVWFVVVVLVVIATILSASA